MPRSLRIGYSGFPAWRQGAALSEWIEIAGTSGAGGAQVNPFSGFTITSGGLIVIAAAGGHTDSADNRVVSLDLMADSPSWTLRVAASTSTQIDVPHYADGKPSSRHTYTNGFEVAGRLYLVGCNYPSGSGVNFSNVDALNLANWTWDAANTYNPVPSTPGYRGVVCDGTHIWVGETLARFNPATNTWDAPISSRAAATPSTPYAFDSNRAQIFGMQYASGLRASKIPIGGSTETAVTINASAAYTQWLADAPADPFMTFDAANDRFLTYDGRGGRVGRVFAVTPNSGAAWDMSILSIGGTPPGATIDAGIQGRGGYVPALGGFVVLPERTSNLFFCRTA